MSLKLEPTSSIKIGLGIEPNGRVQRFFTNTCYKHMDKYVPKDNGDLRTNVDIQPSKIIYESPYARYQYYGVREDGTHKVQHYTTPGTGPYWDHKMMSIESEQVVKEVQDFVNRGGLI